MRTVHPTQASCLLVTMLLAAAPLYAQQAPRIGQSAGNRTPPAVSARAAAPFDATGYWVSLVTQNWRYRMVVPAHGDYAGIPINAKARSFANAWNAAGDVAAGKACEAYGAPNLMQIPERLQIDWQDQQTLRVATDAGGQTRLLHFGAADDASTDDASADAASADNVAASLQGYSRAHWQLFTLANSFGAADRPKGQRYGSLIVVTDHLLPGLLRKNGVPYGSAARMSEYWKVLGLGSEQWLTISTSIKDPEYLLGPYVYDSLFQREADGSQRDPSPCSLTS